MFGVRFKDGAFPAKALAPAGIRILGALDGIARLINQDIIVTCSDGDHPPTDPHSLGEAFDVRTHDLPHGITPQTLLREVIERLEDPGEQAAAVPGITIPNLAIHRFYAQIENIGQPNEHLHVQRRNGTVYA